MGRKKITKVLNVYLNQVSIGDLVKAPNGQISFQYATNWLEEGFPISHSLPLQESEYKGEVVNRYFDNLLPDNEQIKNTVAHKFGAESTRVFDMLEVIGRDCVGALSFVPEGLHPSGTLAIKAKEITENEIAQRLKGLSTTTPLGMKDADFRISIAGAQEKTALLKKDGKWFEPIGLTPTTHIFKTSIGAMGVDLNFQDSVDNEWFSLYLLGLFGLKTAHAEIETFEDQKVLVVERFDRRWREFKGKEVLVRLPQEDMCQALGVSSYKKYQSDGGPGVTEIANFLRASNNQHDRFDFFKTIMLFDLLYATDGHAKNFSIFINQDGFKLTPIYDVMSGYFLHKREKVALEKLKLAMKIGDSGHYAFKRIKLKHYEQTAAACGISKEHFDQICDEIKTSFSKLNIEENKLPANLNQNTAHMILEGLMQRKKKLL